MSWLSRVVSRAVGGGLLLVAISTASLPAAAQDKISEEAKLYFKNGVELIQSQPPNYQDAYYQFKLAWEKSKSWKVLGNWGLCALKLERDGEAIWAYTEYLKQKDIDPDERKDLERDLLLLNGNAASVTLTSDIADLELQLTTGVKWNTPLGVLGLGITENILNHDNTPDIGVHVSWGYLSR